MLEERLIRLLDVASRETTTEPEALSALRFFRKSLVSTGIDLREALGSEQNQVRISDNGGSLSLASYKRKVAQLEDDLSEVELEKETLLQSNLQLESRLRAAEKQLLDLKRQASVLEEEDPSSFAAFEKAAVAKAGKKWRAAMSAQTRFTYADFRNWETSEKEVPEEAFDAIQSLTPIQAESFKWDNNPDAVRRVFELKNQGKKTRDIASHISDEFKVQLKPNAVKFCLQLKRVA